MSLNMTANVGKSYGGKTVLEGCSFDFLKDGIYAILGPNGSGKSTFLRVCALLEEPDQGRVDFLEDGIPPHENAPDSVGPSTTTGSYLEKNIRLRRRITLLLPKIGVFNATVYQNVAYGLKVRDISKKDIEEKVSHALELVGLSDKKIVNACGLSSGETQRLGIARALVIEPEILFLDEPTSSLDPHNTSIIEDAIVRIAGKKRTIIIMVTHNMFQARRLSDHVLFMHGGRIIDHGATKEFFAQPKDERAHRFITGQMVY
jgi:ABC-type phosphate transport system ATPase subunit